MSEKTELSKLSKYWIPRHRYLELKHFCLQYPDWKKAYASMGSLKARNIELPNGEISQLRITEHIIETREYFESRISLIEETARLTDPILGIYILNGATKGLSYDKLICREPIPCCREIYYQMYRKFFWLLSKSQNLQRV